MATNPRAILRSLNGFGSNSAWSSRHAYAPIVHGTTGLLRDQSESNNALLPEPDDRTMNPIYDAGPRGIIAKAGAEWLIRLRSTSYAVS